MATSKYLGTSDPWAVQHSSNVVVARRPRGRARCSRWRCSRAARWWGREAPNAPGSTGAHGRAARGRVGRRNTARGVAAQLHGGLSGLGLSREDLVLDDLLANVAVCRVHKPAKHDASRKIFVVGFKKTGTTTMERILATLKMTPALPGKIRSRPRALRAAGRTRSPPRRRRVARARLRGLALVQRGGNTSIWRRAPSTRSWAKRHENARFILTVRRASAGGRPWNGG